AHSAPSSGLLDGEQVSASPRGPQPSAPQRVVRDAQPGPQVPVNPQGSSDSLRADHTPGKQPRDDDAEITPRVAVPSTETQRAENTERTFPAADVAPQPKGVFARGSRRAERAADGAHSERQE